ncbi:MAG: hypothetical protein KJN90_07400, partial [Gammaproteobacteria bacterium]|nr:hypothetical protein [Gammaproteobacteria bacterium]
MLQRTGRFITGLIVLCAALPGYGQTDEEAGEQAIEAPEERVSVYQTLVFDRPIAIPEGGELAERETTGPGRDAFEAPADELDPLQVLDLQRFQDTVSAIELEGGAWDINLTENLTSMGEIYQQQGMHQQAIDYFSRAMHVSRVNFGLNSLDHLPFVERMIDSFLALGDWESADQYQEYLYYAQSREFGMDDPRMVPVLYQRASWELSVFNARWGDE